KVRELARKKAERALEIGRFFNASLFIYNADSDGFDSPFTVNWQEAWIRLANGLDAISQYANSQKMTNYRGGCLAPRQSASYLYGFINTPSDALAMINGLIKDRAFWGIAPSSAQLQIQGWEKAPAQIANIIGARRLAFLKVGGGTEKPVKRAMHPILGTGNLTETAQLFWLLERLNWKGAVEYDNLASISDAKSMKDDMTCKQFMANCANALTAALLLAERIKVTELAELTPSEADLMAATLLGNLDVDNIILRTIKNLPQSFDTQQQRAPQQNAKPQNGKPQKQKHPDTMQETKHLDGNPQASVAVKENVTVPANQPRQPQSISDELPQNTHVASMEHIVQPAATPQPIPPSAIAPNYTPGAPLPPPVPLKEEEDADNGATNDLPLILPDEKKPKAKGRKSTVKGRKSSGAVKRSPRRKPNGDKK
ncbi:MAG: hypothetical protein J6X55_06330, partial [Victivallales bacterium]|nr:hypothetical protein [Victivallales bacterium]